MYVYIYIYLEEGAKTGKRSLLACKKLEELIFFYFFYIKSVRTRVVIPVIQNTFVLGEIQPHTRFG